MADQFKDQFKKQFKEKFSINETKQTLISYRSNSNVKPKPGSFS